MRGRFDQDERRIAGEQQTFARPLRSLLRGKAVTCDGARTIAEAAALMRAEAVGSVVIVDAAGRPAGILTSHDMVGALADGAGTQPVAERMSRTPFTLPAHALAYEAAVAMISQRIRHVVVVAEDGRVAGMVSERDLFSLQRLGLGEITMEIRAAQSEATVAVIAADVRKLTVRLVEQGVAAEQLMALVSVLNDRLSQRVIEIVRKRHELERISWCWLAFGSEGRLEQTFASDQDNGLLFQAHDEAPEAARARLLPFAHEVNLALDACGFPLCRGNVMASNPELCLSLEEWRAKMSRWVESSVPKALLDAVICFDFRPIHGDGSVAERLRAWVHELTARYPLFLRHMAENAMRAQPALGRLGGYVVSDAEGAPGTIDLKANGAKIFIDAARIFALAHAVPQTNTAERLRGAQAAMRLSEAQTRAAVDAFFVLQGIRLRIQAGSSAADPALQNRIAPERLGRIENAALKEALRVGRELQERLALDYRL